MIPGEKLATLRQQGSRIGTRSYPQSGVDLTFATYVPTTPVTLLDQQEYWLKLVDPAVDGDDAAVSTAAVSLTASDREAPTRSNAKVWTGQYKWQILDASLYRTRGGDTTSTEGWVKSEDAIRIYVGADADESCSLPEDEAAPEPENVRSGSQKGARGLGLRAQQAEGGRPVPAAVRHQGEPQTRQPQTSRRTTASCRASARPGVSRPSRTTARISGSWAVPAA